MNRFENQVALVTGAGIGIGYAICQGLAREGAIVALNDMKESLAHEAARKINEEVGRECVFPYVCDVSDVEGVQRMVTTIDERFGHLDILIANAGLTAHGGFLDFKPDVFDRVSAVNLRGSYFTAQACAHAMIARNIPGRIVLVSSVTGVQAFKNLGAYGVTKAGLLLMAKTIALEVGQYGITANVVVPGVTITERTLDDSPNLEKDWPSVLATGRVCHSEDIAAGAIFLASPEARQITGQQLIVDGGWVMHSPLPSGSATVENPQPVN